MMILVTYDISVSDSGGTKRLRQISKACLDYGIRVQNSVFECNIDPAQWVKLKANLLKIYDKAQDSLRFYMLGSNWRPKVEHHGVKPAVDAFCDMLII